MDIKELKEVVQRRFNENRHALDYDDLKEEEEILKVLDELTESKKVKIPQIVADWIEDYRKNGYTEPINIVKEIIDNRAFIDRFDWLKDVRHQKLLLLAVTNGYEIGEQKYIIYIPSMRMWLADSDGEVKPTATRSVLNNMTYKRAETWKFFDKFNNAELLEIKEVE